MRGRARSSRGKAFAGAKAFAGVCVLAACGFLGPLAGAAFAAGNATLNGPGELRPMRLALGDLTIGTPAGCSVAYTLQVLTDVGTGSDEFELQVYDDGALTQVVALSAPADGLAHDFSGTIELDQPVSQVSPGNRRLPGRLRGDPRLRRPGERHLRHRRDSDAGLGRGLAPGRTAAGQRPLRPAPAAPLLLTPLRTPFLSVSRPGGGSAGGSCLRPRS